MAEHEEIQAARAVLMNAQEMLIIARNANNQSQVNVWEGATAAAQRKLDAAIAAHGS